MLQAPYLNYVLCSHDVQKQKHFKFRLQATILEHTVQH